MAMTPGRIRSSHERARGQVMPLFALLAVFLLVMAGLAVDAGMSYLNSDQVERAAAAAALAGVAYLPGEIPQAKQAALIEAARNGYSNVNDTSGTSASCAGTYPCIVVSQPALTTNELEVTIDIQVPTTFLEVVGFGPHLVARSATAEFLPPISLGQPGAQQGSPVQTSCNGLSPTGYCATTSTGLGSGGSNFYFERAEGWGNPRSEGDPFTPTPNDLATSCGTPTVSCQVSSPNYDYHQISPIEGTESWGSNGSSTYMNYTGGSSYLISVAPQQSVDVDVYNPAFAPDVNDQTAGDYTYHEDDSSFPSNSTLASDYSAMSYTIFSVPSLSSDTLDSAVSQEVFYPYNASCLYEGGATCGGTESYSWFNPAGLVTQTAAVVKNVVPDTYHQWVSMLNYSIATSNSPSLASHPIQYGSHTLTNTNPAGGLNMYWRLEVDTLQWNGNPTCGSSSCDSSAPSTGTGPTTDSNGQSKAHKGYAVQIAPSGSITECTTGTCGNSSISAMGDMTVYTPVKGSTATSFSIPLFSLDPSYAGQNIEVDIFDIGDVGGGLAYVGIQEPNGGPFADATSIVDLGNSVGTKGSANVTSAWPNAAVCAPSSLTDACFQTASGGGSAIYNGQWVKLVVNVPVGYTLPGSCATAPTGICYWNLVYQVAPAATAGDTFAVQVGFVGSPDRLLP